MPFNDVFRAQLWNFSAGDAKLFTETEVIALRELWEINTVGRYLTGWRTPAIQKYLTTFLGLNRAALIASTFYSFLNVTPHVRFYTPELERAIAMTDAQGP